MKKQKTFKNLLLCIISVIILIFFTILSCQAPGSSSGGGGGGGGGGDDGPEITITNVGWVIENIDPSFWLVGDSRRNTTCFYNWFINYSGDNINQSDIQSARIYAVDENRYWDVISGNNFDGTNKRIGGWARWYWITNHILPIGNFRAEVILTNGHTTTSNVIFPAPGSTSTNGYRYIYSENIGSPGANYTPMIRRATIVSGNIVGTDITILFNVDDNKIYNGYVAFYNSAEPTSWVGSTNYFRNWDTEAINADLLAALNTNGTNSTVTISDSEISYNTGKTFADIDQFIVVLSDGLQYVSQPPKTYDCLSRSAKTDL